MTFGSVCSGIEAASCAWVPLGWRCAFTAEIERFPSAVLKHHYPDVPNLGDMLKHKTWNHEQIDLLVGGTPCQSFSVAGLRKGLADPRGNLTLAFLGVVDRTRPSWVVWENVPGILSDKTGAFGAFLGGLGQLGYGFAYRILDAQYFGVAQRRRRVFVVGHSGGLWQRAAAVLFERESLRGNPPPSREAGKRIAATVSGSTPSRRNGGSNPTEGHFQVAKSLRAQAKSSHREDTETVIPIQEIGKRQSGTPMNGVGYGAVGAPMFTLQKSTQHGICAMPLLSAVDKQNLVCATLTKNYATHHGRTAGNNGGVAEGQLVPTCPSLAPAWTARDGKGERQDVAEPSLVSSGAAVRRLTPVECERLQGFPDNYTNIFGTWPLTPDGPRYKALGNSMAVPVMAWIGRRIALVERLVPS